MQYIITEAQSGMSLRHFLQQELRLSSKMIKHLKFSEDGILINGEHATVRRTLCAGDCVELAIEDREFAPIEPIDLPITILYEDEDVVVPAKPANMPTHPSHDHYTDTVANALSYRYHEAGIPFVFRPINRLDRNTSGLLLIARNRPSAGRLTEAMQAGKIEKRYLAVLDGELADERGRIDACLHRTAQSIILREVCPHDAPDADTALTEYIRLAAENGHSLVEARPITGRTHQLRVHFASIGHPITGDDLYGNPNTAINRHALHAYSLSFPHPETGESMTLTAPPPKDFCDLLRLYFPNYRLQDLNERNAT